MRRVLAVAVLALGLSPAMAQDGDGNGPMTGVIQSQIDAFLADDFETAFSFASPMIKGLFGNPERFGAMVRNGYPMVWRPSQVEFLESRVEGGRVYQQVLVRGPQGAFHILDYQMVETEDGWQINGVQILPAPDVAA